MYCYHDLFVINKLPVSVINKLPRRAQPRDHPQARPSPHREAQELHQLVSCRVSSCIVRSGGYVAWSGGGMDRGRNGGGMEAVWRRRRWRVSCGGIAAEDCTGLFSFFWSHGPSVPSRRRSLRRRSLPWSLGLLVAWPLCALGPPALGLKLEARHFLRLRP